MVGRPLLVLAAVWSAVSGTPADVLAQQSNPNLGRNLAAACASCHGANGASRSGIAGLAGRDPSEIARLMQDFRSGRRPATVMQQIARGYSDEQVAAIAAYLAAQRSGSAR